MVSRTLLCVALLGLFAAACVSARPGVQPQPDDRRVSEPARGSATPNRPCRVPHVCFQRARRHVWGSPLQLQFLHAVVEML